MNSRSAAKLVKDRARELGFDRVGICDLSPAPHEKALVDWLDNGMAGEMKYMHRQRDKRLRPADIVPGATRAVVVTFNYYNVDPPSIEGTGLVAKYARGQDYHSALNVPLTALEEYIRSLGDKDTIAKAYVDAGPVPERELAQRAGLGWIGKNTMLIDPKTGSFFFIAVVLTNLELEIDVPFQADRCGSCRACLDACPTDAFTEERVLDSRLCISYLTIEYRGEIPPDLAPAMSDRVFGCDICQDVCPWNEKFAEPADSEVLNLQPELARINLRELAEISASDFDDRYGWTPLERPGREGMRRNAEVVLGNRKHV